MAGVTPLSTVRGRLLAPFPASSISWRVGSTTADKSRGQALAYLDARDVRDRLDEATDGRWQCEYVSMANGTCCCRIGIKVGDEWLWRSNGAGETDVEGEKGQYSSALKRAAVMFGIGAYLYRVENIWVELEPRGKTHVIKPGQERKLADALARAAAEAGNISTLAFEDLVPASKPKQPLINNGRAR